MSKRAWKRRQHLWEEAALEEDCFCDLTGPPGPLILDDGFLRVTNATARCLSPSKVYRAHQYNSPFKVRMREADFGGATFGNREAVHNDAFTVDDLSNALRAVPGSLCRT